MREVFFHGWPRTLNKFWCHWFHLAHPNTLFAIYLVPSIRPVVYGILLHAYTRGHSESWRPPWYEVKDLVHLPHGAHPIYRTAG